MLALYFKEINSFLTSLIGYIAISVFLVTISLFMWVFSGSLNVLESGYSNIDALFIVAPWVFLFLVPAVTMRLFADEKKSGTIELLLTQPLTDLQITLAKYLAGVTLVLISLIPTLIYFLSVYWLGNPVGNIDTGGTWGSYLGLFFLASAFVAIGLFCSSLSDNQIIAFILAVFLCFIIYMGFESLAALDFFGSVDNFIIQLGIQDHYLSMSHGVIDTRDVIYFLSLVALFIVFTKTKLESRKWQR